MMGCAIKEGFLEEFAREFGVEEMVSFECEVVSAELCSGWKWRVKSKRKRVCSDGDDGFDEEVFDIVVVCNGHHTEPHVAEISGVGLWPGKQIHSHNYRTPEPFRDKDEATGKEDMVLMICRLQEGLGKITNNVAEYRAMFFSLKYALKKGFTNIRVQGDSKLVCSQIQGVWKVKHQNLTGIYKQAKLLKNKFTSFQITHVLREFNSEADAQANLAIYLTGSLTTWERNQSLS